MQSIQRNQSYLCARCLRASAQRHQLRTAGFSRQYASSTETPPDSTSDVADNESKGQGALSRRLAQMSEESLETGGRSAKKAVEEAGFSQDLKDELEAKIANASFKSEYANAFAEANLPSNADRVTRDIAGAKAWTGSESLEDATLRMLTDAHKPMRGTPKTPSLRAPSKIDTGRPSRKEGPGTKLLNARDRTSAYAWTKDPNLSEEEREKIRKEMKHRFQGGTPAVPATIAGLTSLANERIEDAIARGQFKNIKGRGKQIERDYNASSPFINTTEYFMNKMIQKQEVVPPWIEKQQELLSTATRFRSRLRTDWRRHVARMISSKGGGLEKQMKLAEEYSIAEAHANPRANKVEKMHAVDDKGHVSQITLEGETKPAPNDAPSHHQQQQTEIKVMEQQVAEDGTLKAPDEQVTVSAEQPEALKPEVEPTLRAPSVPPYRDPEWEQTEGSYLRTAIENLNSMTRSYNLMAPVLAKKPYFTLERELQACYADVAPTVADAIRERALAPKIKGVESIGHKPGGVMDKFGMDRAAHVYDEQKPQYGFKEFWRDLFSKK
ncbi:hypothetical protein KC360_g1155 [Hortaea werneckii]|nr:hypothetical protein KC325_g1815 [Hortaea werneckii]KAI6998491.1 hypothetical protein KC359_g2297 [Hortaea werneckii]KAI7149224.1 hypothetical protein KC344_g1169 [Hortaea werneckii]KAI7178940.1 hypothetical protein KC360_g1155 [Hortaea werneckii]